MSLFSKLFKKRKNSVSSTKSDANKEQRDVLAEWAEHERQVFTFHKLVNGIIENFSFPAFIFFTNLILKFASCIIYRGDQL